MRTKKCAGPFKAILTISLLSFQSLCNTANALPTIYPQVGMINTIKEITNTTDSNLVADTLDSKKIYVMPPNSSEAIVEKKLFLRTTNLGRCKEMQNLIKYSSSLAADLADYKGRANSKKNELEEVNLKLREAREELVKYTQGKRLTELFDLDKQMSDLDTKIALKTSDLKTCENNCRQLKDQIETLEEESALLFKRRYLLAQSMTEGLNGYEKFKREIDYLEEEKAEIGKIYKSMKADVEELRDDFDNIYNSFGKLEGARAAISFKSKWDKNVESLRELNKGFDFEKIQTANAFFTTDMMDLNDVPSTSAVMAYKISACTNGNSGQCLSNSFPEDFTGTVVLSTIGACPIEHPEYFDLDLSHPNSANELRMGLSVAYDYPTAMSVKVTAKYNLSKVYSKIVSNGTSGGLFSNRAWSSEVEDNFFSDLLTVDWTVQDSLVALPNEEKKILEHDMRFNIIERLAKVGLPTVINPSSLIPPPSQKSGMLVLSESLASTNACKANGYCMGAAIFTSVLDAIFGSSLNSASYKNIQDVTLTEQYSSEAVVLKPYMTTYLKK